MYSFMMDIKLWQDVHGNFSFPVPRVKHIIPNVFSEWNDIKGGSDSTTQLVARCQYCVPNNENQSHAVARMLSLAAVDIHRLYQVSSAKANLNFYSCLKRFRDSASERTSFKKTQFMVVSYAAATSSVPDVTPTPSPTQPSVQERSSRSQAGIEKISIPFVLTNKTPQRNVHAKYAEMEERLVSGRLDRASQIVLERSNKCVGMPVKRTDKEGKPGGKGARGTCALCGADTHNFCLLCKQWLCNAATEKAEKLPGWKTHIIINPDEPKAIHAQNTCFFRKHRVNIEATMKEVAQSVSSSAALPHR